MNLMKTFFLFLLAFGTCGARADLVSEVKPVVCAKDAKTFCHRFKPMTASYVECMSKHLEELEPDCKEKIERLKEKLGDIKSDQRKAREACRDDFFKYCQGIPLDETQRRNCLIRHEKQLSKDCLEALRKAK